MGKTAGRTVAIGIQDFGDLIRKGYFYVDKTDFIREWWESGDSVTLITRPRRFGKTLNMSMIEHFFSLDYAGQGELFEGLAIWEHDEYRRLQGEYPVISLSFANIKEREFRTARKKICQFLANLYVKYSFLRDSEILTETDRIFFDRILAMDMDDSDASLALYQLSNFLYRYYGKKVIILLDEYDTPMQEAYVDGYWDELVAFTRSLFNAAFKTNPWLERAILTGITRVKDAPSPLGSKTPRQVDEVGFHAKLDNTSLSIQCHSVFSDLNNLEVVTTTSNKYTTSFGFTEEEVFAGLDECGYSDQKEQIKRWYDGFIFGDCKDIYNPWSILNFLDKGEYMTYWANTSSNSLVSRLIREGSRSLKENFESLLLDKTIRTQIDEQIVYSQLNGSEKAIWSLLLASGYLKVLSFKKQNGGMSGKAAEYELSLTNMEVKLMFRDMVQDWFSQSDGCGSFASD